jgi:hypothetical protein
VTLDRKDHYLGAHGSSESRIKYERSINEWLNPEVAPAHDSSPAKLTVAELAVVYLRHATLYYR